MGFFDDLNPVRIVEDVATGGLAEFAQKDPFGVPGGGNFLPLIAGAGVGALAGNPLAGLGVGGSLFSATQAASAQRDTNAANIGLAREAMAFSADQAQKQRDFEMNASNTSIQRQAKDMVAAGINPMLAAGAGASTPSVSSPSGIAPTVNPVPAVASSMFSSAMDMVRLATQVKSTMASATAAEASAASSVADAKKKGVETTLLTQKKPEASVMGRLWNMVSHAMSNLDVFSSKSLSDKVSSIRSGSMQPVSP